MKISYNPIDALAAVTAQTAANDSIIFDLRAAKLWAKGVRIGADWTDISSKPSSLKNPEAIKFRDINGNEVSYDGSAAKDLTTGIYMAKLPYGFSSFNAKPTWGNTEGTSIASWNDGNGGSIDFRKDNPLKGKMSIKVNGRVYVNDGVNPVLSAEINNGFWGIRTPDGDNNWIRTPDKGLLPYKSGGAGSGNSSLGTDSWYFSKAYIDTVYGSLKGNADTATNADTWTTPRTFTIGNTSKNVDGSTNMSWTLAEIGIQDTWRQIQVNGTSIGNNTLNLSGSDYIGVTNDKGKVTFSLIGSTTTANQVILSTGKVNEWKLWKLNINNWDEAYRFVSTISGSDTNKVIDRWDEIKNFLEGINDNDKLNTLLNSKLSVYELANNTDVSTLINNGIYYSTTDTSSSTLTSSPFDKGFALLNITNYQEGDNLIRSRLAFNSQGELKIFDGGATEPWHNVLTSKNSGIDTDNSIITLNGQTIEVPDSAALSDTYVKKIGDTMSGALTIETTSFGALVIQRSDDVNGTSIQFRGKSSVYGYIGLNNTNKNKQLLRWGSDATKNPYIILDTSSTYVSTDGIGQINGINITKVNNAKNADYASSAASAIKVVLNQDSISDTEYSLVWSDQPNKDHFIESRLLKSWNDLCYNPKNKRLTVVGSVNTASITATDINATNAITSAGFIHSGITENPEQYILTANGGYTLLNQISNESVYEFNKTIAVTSEWMDIDEFYGGNQKFLAQSGTYIVQVYVNGTDDRIYENYFSGIMSWYIHQTNSNNSDEIILHRVGHDYSNTIYLRTKESPNSGYAKLQISANKDLKKYTYTFKFKRIC